MIKPSHFKVLLLHCIMLIHFCISSKWKLLECGLLPCNPHFPCLKYSISVQKNDLTNEIILDTSHYYFVFWSYLVWSYWQKPADYTFGRSQKSLSKEKAVWELFCIPLSVMKSSSSFLLNFSFLYNRVSELRLSGCLVKGWFTSNKEMTRNPLGMTGGL